jgi:O-antigen/teichoic acid export membrane protein
VVSTALVILAALGAVAVLILLAFGLLAPHLFNVPSDLQDPLRLLFILLAAEAAVGLPALAFAGLLEGLQRYPVIRLVDFGRQALAAVLVFIVLLRHGGVVWFGAAMTAGSVVAAVGYAIAAKVAMPDLRVSLHRVQLATLRPLAGFSAWVFLARINSVAWRQMDKVILAAVLASTVLTGYEVAARIQGAAAFALAFTASAVVPATAALAAQGSTERLRDLLLRGTRYTMAVCLPITIGAMILAEPLIVGWVGPDFADMAGATQLFLAYQLTVSAASIANTMLVGLGRIRAVTLYVTIAAAVNLVFSIILVHPWGIKGVIAGTLIGYGITTPLYIRLVLQELGLGLGRFLRESVLPVLPWAASFAVVVEITRRLIEPTHLITTLATAIPALLIYTVGFVYVGMDRAERARLTAFLLPADVGKSSLTS